MNESIKDILAEDLFARMTLMSGTVLDIVVESCNDSVVTVLIAAVAHAESDPRYENLMRLYPVWEQRSFPLSKVHSILTWEKSDRENDPSVVLWTA